MEERIIVVDTLTTKQTKTGKNAGKNFLVVKDKGGGFYSIFNSALFGVFVAGRAVKLTGEQSGEYFNTDKAELVDVPYIEEEGVEVESVKTKPQSGQEHGMLMKELGENIRTGFITKEDIAGKKTEKAKYLFEYYFNELYHRIKFYDTGE